MDKWGENKNIYNNAFNIYTLEHFTSLSFFYNKAIYYKNKFLNFYFKKSLN